MTGYGVPPTQASPQRPAQSALFDLIAAGLGVLSFVWGFLNWYEAGSGEVAKGYAVGSPGAAAIGLSLLAAAVVVVGLLEKKTTSSPVPLAASVAALLVTFGLLVGKGDGVSTKIGLILELITVLLQSALFAVSWLQASGRLGAGATVGGPPQWGAPTQQYGYAGAPPGYGPPPPAQPSYGPPPQQPPAQPPYGPPPQQPGYGQPGQHQAPQQPPQQQQQPPQQQPGYGQPPSGPYGRQG